MKRTWIKQEGNRKCILFFNGWGMDEHVLHGFDHTGFDVCQLNDFNSVDPLCPEEYPYPEIIVVAWSLGVCAANEILSKSELEINQSLAINGTPWAWHDELAIPHLTFQHTLTGWNDQNRYKFNLRMFGGKHNLEEASSQISRRSADGQKTELQFFRKLGELPPAEAHSWDIALVGMNDRIVPAVHQLRFWGPKAKVIRTDWPHFPFLEIKSWNGLLNLNE